MEDRIVISNNVDELSELAAKVEDLAEQWKWPSSLTMNINLVLEEAVSNIIFYAFTDQAKHEVSILVSMNENELTLVIEDEGRPFDPTKIEQPDLSLSVEDRPVGGLGIFLISKIMDHFAYERKDGKNILTLHKTVQL